MKFEIKQGKLSLVGSSFENGSVVFNCGKSSFEADKLSWSGNGGAYSAEAHGVEYRIDLSNGALVFEIVNGSDCSIFLDGVSVEFAPADVGLRSENWMEYVNAFSFEKRSGVKRVGLANQRLEANPSSSMLYLISNRNRPESILFATSPPHNGDYVSFKASHDAPHCEGMFGLSIRIDVKAKIPAGESIKSTAIIAERGESPLELLEKYGERWRKIENRPLKPKVSGWNSWDYFSGAVTSKDIFDNLEVCETKFPGKLEYFVIDEGYEPRWGVWDANWKFPEGLDGYCERIKKAGRKPGVWSAPLLVNTYTDIYLNHPEWFARNADGTIATKSYSYGPMAFLDVTRPEAEAFLRETFARLRSCGFEYFKVDFTQEILKAELFHDEAVSRGALLRKAFSAIREEIGEESYLLACGAPYESVTGIVDACRTTGDIHNFWGHVLANAEAMAGKWWMQGNLWNNDPDFLIVRTPETCELKRLNREYPARPLDKSSYWLAGRELNLNEAKTYAQLIRFSGGDVFLSDDIASLNGKGLRLIEKVLDNPIDSAARPVDLFDRHESIPEIWFADAPSPALGLFNWDDDPKTVPVDLAKLGLTGLEPTPFWGDEVFSVENGALSAELAPRACAAFSFKPKKAVGKQKSL